jgi:hypothetical protein
MSHGNKAPKKSARSQDNTRVVIGAKGTKHKVVRKKEKKKKGHWLTAIDKGGARSDSRTGKAGREAGREVGMRGGRSAKSDTQSNSMGVDLVDVEELKIDWF